jgi:hypothetical protein
VFGVVLIWILWLTSIIVLPLVLVYVCGQQYEETYGYPGFKKWFGHLHDNEAGGVSVTESSKKAFFMVFLSRRWFMLLMIFTLFRRPCQQIQLLLLVFLFVIIYKAG